MNTTTSLQLYQRPDTLLAKVDELGVQCTSLQRKLINASGAEPGSKVIPLAQMELRGDDGAIAIVGALLKGVFRDLGITKEPDQYDGARFLQVIRDYFPRLTVNDIKTAFELHVMGELDRFYPKGKHVEHFQSFSVAYWSAVLRAYQQRQAEAIVDVTGKVGRKMLEQQTRKSPQAERLDFLNIVRERVAELLIGDVDELKLMVDGRLASLMIRLKVIDQWPVPNDDDKRKAVEVLSRGKSWTIARIYEQAAKGMREDNDFTVRAAIIAAKRVIIAGLKACDKELVLRRLDWMVDEHKKKHNLA